MLKTYQLSLDGMTCTNCSGSITRALRKALPNKIHELEISHISQSGLLTLEVTPNENTDKLPEYIQNTIEEIGFECLEVSTQKIKSGPLIKSSKKITVRQHLLRAALGLGLGVLSLALCMSGLALPIAALGTLMGICTLTTLYLGYSSFKDAYTQARLNQSMNMNTLFTISTTVALLSSLLSFFIPGFPLLMAVGLFIFGFRHIGNAIKESMQKILIARKNFVDLIKPKVFRWDPDHQIEIETDIQAIEVDEFVLWKPGETLGLDGILLSSTAEIDERNITGITETRSFIQGEAVLAGMHLPENSPTLLIQVKKKASESNLAMQDQDLQHILLKKTPLENQINRLLQYFVPTVIGIAVVASIAIGIFFPPMAIPLATYILVSACPCVLGFMCELAKMIGIIKAKSFGIEVQKTEAIEVASKVDTVVFDLNGTLTQGEPSLIDFKILKSGLNQKTLFEYVYLLESKAKSHGIAKALLDAAELAGIEHSNKTAEFHRQEHGGISAKIDGMDILIGDSKFMAHQSIDINSLSIPQHSEFDKVIYIADHQTILGYFILQDRLREDAIFTSRELKKLGIKRKIFTGSPPKLAKAYARALGIPDEDVEASMTPKDKCDSIRKLQAKGHTVCVVEDAENGALGIAQSDFGIAMKSKYSHPLTQQEASAISVPRVLPVLSILTISKQVMSNMKGSFLLSILYNMSTMSLPIVLILAFGFAINPALGAALMIIQASLILLGQYYLKHKKLDHIEAYEKQLSLNNQAKQNTVKASYQQLHQQGLLNQNTPMKNANASSINHSSSFTPLLKEKKKTPIFTTPHNLACQTSLRNGL